MMKRTGNIVLGIIIVIALVVVGLAFLRGGNDTVETPTTDWLLTVYGQPYYTYASKRVNRMGYESLDACLRVGRQELTRSGDPKEWFQCSKDCKWSDTEFDWLYCDLVCEQTGDCRD